MITQTVATPDKMTTPQLLEELFQPENTENIRVRLWDGSFWPGDREANATLLLNHPGALRAMLLPGTELGMAEVYLYNDIDIEGSVEAVFDLADSLTLASGSLHKKIKLLGLLKQLPTAPPRPVVLRVSFKS